MKPQFRRQKMFISDAQLDALGEMFVDFNIHRRSGLTFEAFVALFYHPMDYSLWVDLVAGKVHLLNDVAIRKLTRTFWATDSSPQALVRPAVSKLAHHHVS